MPLAHLIAEGNPGIQEIRPRPWVPPARIQDLQRFACRCLQEGCAEQLPVPDVLKQFPVHDASYMCEKEETKGKERKGKVKKRLKNGNSHDP
jgi:hypothetical protein